MHWDSISNLDGDEASGDYTFSVAGPGTAAIGDVAVATPTLDPDANGNPLSKDSQFDSGSFFLSLGAGALALILIIGFWLRVRPKSPNLVREQGGNESGVMLRRIQTHPDSALLMAITVFAVWLFVRLCPCHTGKLRSAC